MDFFKGLIPGTILTLLVAGILGANRFNISWLSIFHQTARFDRAALSAGKLQGVRAFVSVSTPTPVLPYR